MAIRPLNRKTAMSVRMRRRNEFLEFCCIKFEIRCYVCGERIDPSQFRKWDDGLTILHHDCDESNKDADNLEISCRPCYHRLTAARRRYGKEVVPYVA